MNIQRFGTKLALIESDEPRFEDIKILPYAPEMREQVLSFVAGFPADELQNLMWDDMPQTIADARAITTRYANDGPEDFNKRGLSDMRNIAWAWLQFAEIDWRTLLAESFDALIASGRIEFLTQEEFARTRA